MASIFKRVNKDKSITWRVQIRRKGLKPFITCFPTKKEAEKFVKECEREYCLNPETFTYDHLKARRNREFGKCRSLCN